MRALGISLSAGSTLAPGVEPFARQPGALAGFDAGAWVGLMGPGHLPQPIVDRLAAEVVSAMEQPEIRARFESISVEPIPRAGAAFTTYLAEQRALFQGIIQRANLRLD